MLKPLFEYGLKPFTQAQFLKIEETKKREATPGFDIGKFRKDYLLGYFETVALIKFNVQCNDSLKLFIVYGLSNALQHLELFAHALKAISLKEKAPTVNIEMFLKYFTGYPDPFTFKEAWDAQKDGLINLIERGDF